MSAALAEAPAPREQSQRPAHHPLRAGPTLPVATARQYRLRAIFECGKLDPQVADTDVLAAFPLIIAEDTWRDIAAAAESLAREALAAEREIAGRPELSRRLGLARSVRSAAHAAAGHDDPGGPRIVRLDFHWASDRPGEAAAWRVSEINADVPGGLIEAGALARLMLELAEAEDRLQAPPDPAEALAAAISTRLGTPGSLAALVHATAYADDYQVMHRVAACLQARGIKTLLAAPDHVRWDDDGMPVVAGTGGRIDAIVRFFPAEWLPELDLSWRNRLRSWRGSRIAGWRNFFRTGPWPASNPATAVLVQSKRWPLIWDRLLAPVPTWRAVLPETRHPDRRWRREASPGDWVLKPAMGRVGEGVLVPGLATRDDKAIRKGAKRSPSDFVAQRRFHSVPVESPLGPIHVCLGVYVVDGHAAGLYARASGRPLIDQGAWEIPVLIDRGARHAGPVEGS